MEHKKKKSIWSITIKGKSQWVIWKLFREEIYNALDKKEEELRKENVAEGVIRYLTSRDDSTIGSIITHYGAKIEKELEKKYQKRSCINSLRKSLDYQKSILNTE